MLIAHIAADSSRRATNRRRGILFREASAILRQIEQLPGLLHANNGVIQGRVNLGIDASLAGTLVGPFIETCREASEPD